MADSSNIHVPARRPIYPSPPATASSQAGNHQPFYPTYSSPYSHDPRLDPSQSGLLEYWNIIRRRRGAVILTTVLGAVIATLITLPQTPIYQARGSVEVLALNDNFINMKQVSPVDQSGGADLIDIQTHVRVLQSEAMIKRVVRKLDLPDARAFANQTSRPAAWRRFLNLPDPASSDVHHDAVQLAAKNLKVRAAGQTRLIEILCDSTDPQLAANFINTLTNEFIDQNVEARWQASQRTGDWLSRQLDDMRIKLERSEENLQAHARRAGLVFTSQNSNVSEDRLKQVQSQFTAARADRIAKQSRLEMAKSSPPEALPDVLNDSSLREYQTKLTDLRRQRAELATRYEPTYPKLQSLDSQIAELQLAASREREAILKRIQNDFDEAQRRESLLSADYRSQTGQVTEQAERSVQYHILKREVDTYRQLYESMLQRVKEASLASALRASNIRIVDPAEKPRFPYKPDLKTSSALGLLSGLFLGVVLVVMRERADRTLRDPSDVDFYLNLPQLGLIPSAHSNKSRLSYYYKRRQSARAAAALDTATANTSMLPISQPAAEFAPGVELTTIQHPSSTIAEAFRATLTSILFSTPSGAHPRSLVITSPSPAEGKTTVAANLAIALAEVNQRVLLIDGDMRRPRLHSLFQLQNEAGLSSLLAANGEFSPDFIRSSIQQTAIPNLSILPSGPETHAAANLLHSRNLSQILTQASESYDMVLLDSPPMLQMPDARILSRQADAVILVTRAGRTTRDAGLAARQRFQEDGTRVLGVVMNDWDRSMSSNYGGSNYYYAGKYTGYYKST
ncbi:MAG: polysaccharide biosynthesis tyrosine autokinase [Bryobacterales bacterium]|nr:polysaccharide biosynthesis tyrosine autokinase [Bryobacterales bacterium]